MKKPTTPAKMKSRESAENKRGLLENLNSAVRNPILKFWPSAGDDQADERHPIDATAR
jgi:hypothetical protein